MRAPLHIALLAGITVSGLAAQSKPATVLPARPLATLHIDGPAALRAAFLPTNIGKMFAGPEFKDMIAPVMQMLEAVKGPGGPQLPFDAAALEKAILNYGGRLAVSFHVLADRIDFNAPKPPPMAITIALTPDGKTDLAGFCKQVHGLAKEMAGPTLQDMDVAGKAISFMHDEDSDEPGICLPFMHKDHAVMVVTKHFKQAVAAVVAEDATHHTADANFGKASIGLRLDVKRLLQFVTAGLKDNLGPMWDAMGAHIYKGSGFDSVDSIEMSYRAQGPAVLSEVALNFNQNDRGLLGAFFTAEGGQSALVDLLSRKAVAANATPCDMKKVYLGIKRIFADMGPAAPMPFEEVEAQFKDRYGIRLFEDLIGLFGKDILGIQLETDQVQASNPLAMANGMCMGFGLSDGAAFAKSVDTILRKDGLHAGRKKADYKGVTIYQMNIAMAFEVHYAVTDNLLLLGLGAVGGDAVRATLDEVQNRANGKDPEPLPAPVRNRLASVKGGYAGLGWSNVEGQMEGVAAMLDAAGGELPPQFDMVGEFLEKLPKFLKTYKLSYQVGITRSSGNRWTYQNIW